MKTTQFTGISVIVLMLLSTPGIISGYDYPSFYREPTGDMLYSEHFASAWCGQIQDGVDGPSLQTVNGKTTFTESDRYGNYYFCDVTSNQVWMRDTAGIVRVIAGTGEHGFMDGPAGQALFYFGPSGYNPYFPIKCDDSGRVYVADMVNNRLRMIYQKPDGRWWVSTLSGGGTQTPAKGEWLSGTRIKWGMASSFGILPDGSAAYYAFWGGLYKVQINHQTPESSLVTIIHTTVEDPVWPASVDAYYQWKSGCMMTPDSVLYWSPGDPRCFLKYDEKTDSTVLFAGSPTVRGMGYDSTGWRLDARWHTHLWTGSPSGRAIFSGSGDDIMIRRMWDDTVKHLLGDGTYKIWNCGGGSCGYIANVIDVDFKGRLFYTYGAQHMYSNLIARMSFENSDTTNNWDHLAGVEAQKNGSELNSSASLFLFPNPFNPATVLHYNLGLSGQKDVSATLTVYRCNGEQVRRFSLRKAEGEVVWQGDDDAGRNVAAGHYLVALAMGNKRLVQRAVLVK